VNPNQALGILDNAVANAPLTRANHVAVQQAIQVLANVVRQFELLSKQQVEKHEGGDIDEIEE